MEDSTAGSIDSTTHATARPSSLALLRVWLALGAQSFGGGSATLYLIQRTAVERQRWLSDEEFARDWAICQLAPGINLLGLTALLGWRVAGARGVALALVGLAVVGGFGVVLARLLRENGIDALAIVIAVGAATLGLTRRVPVLAIIVAAAVVGVLFYRTY